MDQKVKKIDLVQTRTEQLERQQFGFLKPIGKRLGLNVFEWKYPQIDELIAFLNGLPFRTVVICPPLVEEQMQLHEEWKKETGHILIYSNTDTSSSSHFQELRRVIEWVKEHSSAFEALVFVAEGNNADDEHTVFIKEWKEKL